MSEMTAVDLLTRMHEAGLSYLHVARDGTHLALGQRAWRLSAEEWSFEGASVEDVLGQFVLAIDGYAAYLAEQARADAAEDDDFRRWCAAEAEKERS